MQKFEVTDKIVMKKLSDIRPYFKNPRKNDKTVEELVKIIPQVGFNVPILIDEEGVIVKGHARYKAAFKLGMEEVPCVVTHATPEQIRLDRIADNKISELSEWLNEGLQHEVDAIDLKYDDILGDLDLKNDMVVEDLPQDSPEMEAIDSPIVSNEDKMKIYQEIQAKKEQEAEEELKKELHQKELEQVANKAPVKHKYVKCVCKHCGEVFYIPTGSLDIVEM